MPEEMKYSLILRSSYQPQGHDLALREWLDSNIGDDSWSWIWKWDVFQGVDVDAYLKIFFNDYLDFVKFKLTWSDEYEIE
jgi:hypothetical protein